MAPAGASSSPPPGGGRETAPLASSLSPAEQLVFDVKAAAAWTLLHEEFICHLRRFSDDLRALHSKGLAVASEVSSVSAGSTKPEGVGTALSRSLTSFLSLCLAEANQADRLATRLKAEATTPVEAVLEKTQSPQAEQENEDANTPRAAGQTPTGSGVQTAGVAGEVAATAEVQKAAKKLQLAHEELKKSEDSLKELVSLFGSSVAPRLLQKAEERVDRAKRLHATAEADYRSVVNANARPEVTGREETPKARLLAPQKRQDPCSWLVSLVHARPSDALGGFVVAANAGEKRAIVFSSSLGTACVLALRASATCLLDSTRESILGRLPFVKKTDEASRETVIVANLKNLPAEVSRPLLSTEVENCMRRCVDLSLLEDGKPNGTLETTDEAGILTLKNLLKQREKELESEKEQRRALQRERDALEETAHALRIREASRANESEHLKKEVDRLRGLLAASSHRGLGGKTVREEGAFLEDEKRRKLELEPCATRDEMATQGGGRGELWSTVDEELDSESRERGEILPFSRSQSRHPHLPEDSTLPCFSSTSGRGRGTESDATSPVLPTSSGARTNARPAATGARKEDGQLSGEASMPREALDAQLGWLRNQLMYEAYLVSLRRLPLPLLLYHLSPVGARAARRPASAVGDTGRLAPANCLQRSETPGSPPRPSAGSTSPPALSLPARRHPASGGSAAFFCSAVAPTQGDAEPSFSLSWESRRFPNFLVSLVEGLAAAALPRALYECCRVAAVSVLGEERRGALAFGGRDGFAREVSHRMSLLQVQRDREKRQRRERVAKDSTEFSEEDLQMLAYELLLLCAHLHSQYAAFAALVAEADAEGVREGSEESPNEAQKKTETQSASVRHSGEAVAEKASREREREAEVDALLDKTGAAAPSRRRRTLLARRLSAKRQERRAPERPEEEMTGKEAEDASKSEKSRRGTTRKSGGLLFFSRGASGLLTRPTAPGTEREAQAMAAERVGGDCSRDEARLGEKAGGCSPSPRSPRRLAQEDQRKREDPASDGLAPFGVSVEAWLRRTGVVPEARDGSAASWREEGLSRGKRTATLSRWIAPDPPLLHANLKLLRQLLVLSRIAFQIPSSSSNILLRLLVPAADCLWAAGSRNCLHPCDLRFRVARLTEAWQMAAAPASAASLVSPKDIARRPLRKPETSVTFVHPKKRRDQLLRFGGKKLKEEESQPVSDTRHVSFLSPGARQTNRDSCSVTSLSSARSGEQAGARESEKEKTDEKKEKKEKKPGLKSALKRFNAQTTKNALSVMVGPQGHLLWGAQEKKSRGVTETNPATRGLSCPHDLPPVQGGFTLWGDKKSEEGEKDARRQSGDHSSLGGVCESKNGSCRDGKPTTFLKRFSPSCLAFDPVYKAFVKRQLQLLHMATLLRFTRFFRFFFGEALSRRVADLAPELLPAHHRDSKSSEVAFPSLSASPAPGASFEAGGGPLGSARRATPLHPPVSGTFFSSLAQSLRQRTRPARFGPRGPEPGEELHGDNETAFFSEPFFSSYRAPPPFSALYTRTEGSDERAALLYFILCLLCHEAAPEAPFWAYGGDGVVSAETEGPAACPRPPARLLFALEDLADATAAAASLDLLPLRQLAAFYHIFLYLFELDRLLSLANAAGASPCGSWGDPTVDVELLEVEVQVLSERTRAELKSEARQRRQEREARGDWHTEETPEEDETIWELRCTHRTRSGSEMLQRLLFMMTACADLDSAIRIALARRWEAKQRQDTGRPGQGDARGDGESADHEKKLFLEVPRRPGGEMSDALRRSASSRQFFFLSPALPSRVELQQEEAAASQLLTLFFLLLLQNQLQDYRRFFEPASLAHALGLWRSLVRLLLQLVQQRSLSAPSEAVTDPACPACPTSFTGTVIPGGLRAPAGVPAGASVEAEEARRALAPGVCGRTFWAGSAGGGPFFEQCETQAVLLDWRHLEEGDLALWQASVEQRFAALLQISRERGKSFIARGERCSHDEATGGRTSFRESSRRRDREGRERERDEGDPSVNPTSGSGDARHSRLLPFFSPSPGLRSRFALPFFSPGGLGRRATGEAGSSFLDCSEELHCDDENMLRLSLALSGPSILEDSLRCFIYQSLTSAAGREFRGAFVALEADREAQREGRGYSERTRQWKRTTDSPVPADLLRLCEQEQDALLDQVVASLRGFLSHVREELLLYSPVFAPHLPLRNEFSFLILSAARLLVAALLAEVFRTAVWAGTGGEVELLPAKGGAELLEVLGEFEKLCKEVTLSRVSALQPLAIPPLLPPMAPAFLSSVSVRLDAVSSMLRSFLERDSLVPVDPPHSSYSEKAADCWHVVCNLAAAVLETPAPISWILPPFLKFLHSFFVAFSSFCALSPSEAEEGTSAALLLPLLALEQRQLKNFLSLLSAEGRKALKVDAALQSAAMLALAQMSDAEGSKKKRAALTWASFVKMGQRMWGEDEDQKRQRREKHRHSAGFSGDFLEPPCPRGAPSDAGESSAYESAAPSDVESSTRRGRKSFFQVFDSSRGARAKGGAESDGERKEASRASERSSLPPPAPCQQVEGAARTKRGDCSRRRGRGLSLRLKAERETQAARIGPDLALLLQGVDEAERMQRRSCEALAEETRAGRGDPCDEKEEREGKQKRDEENKNRRPDSADGSARCGERITGGTQSQGVLRWLVKLQNVDMFMRELQKLQAKLRAELERRARDRNPKDVEIVEKLATLAGVSEASEEEVEREESEGGIARNQRRAFCQVEQDAQILDLEEMLNQRMQQLHDLLHNTALKVCETAAAYIVYYELQHDIFDRLYGEKEFSFYTLERIVAALPNTVERFFAAAPEGYQDEAAAAFTRCLTQAWCLLLTELGYSGHVFSESEVGTLEADLESLRHYMKSNEISPIFEIASASGEKVSLDMLEKVEDFLVMLARDGACLARVESEKEAERRRTSERDGAGARERSRSFFRGRSSSRRRGSMSPRAGSEEDGKRSRGVSPAFFSFATRAESGNRGFPGETESHTEPVFRAGGGRTSDEDGRDEKKKKGGMGSVGRWMKKNLMGTSAPAKSETDRSRDVSQARAPSDSGDEWNLR